MPNKKKLYDALVQEGYKDFENEEAFNTYVDNADNRKTLFNALKQVGYDIESEKAFDDYLGYSEPQIKGERINNTISGGVGTQEEADAIFEANAKSVREKYNGNNQSPSWGVPKYDWRTDKQKQLDAFSQDNQATVVRDRQGNEYYPIKPMEVAYDEAMKEVRTPTPLDVQIEDRLKANEEALKKAYEKNKPLFANPGVGIGRAYSTSALTIGDSDEIKDLKAEKEYLKNAKAVLNAARNDAGFFAGMKDAVQKASFMDFGVSDLNNAQRIIEVQQKLDSGMPLSESEQNLLSSLGLQQTIEQQYNDMLGSWYKAGMTTADMAPFMLEMVANPASSLGKAAMKATIKKFGEKGAKAVAAKVLSRTIGDVAGAAAMAGTTGLAGTSADALERQQGDATTGVDENGNLIGTGLEGGDDSSTAWRKAFTARTIENWSEMVGQYFEPVGKVLGKGAKKGLEKIGLSKVNDFIDNVNSSEWARTLDDFTEQTQWNGSLGEFGEEQVGMVADALLVGDIKWKDLVDAEKQLDTALGVGVFGTAMSLLRIGGYRTPKYRARKAVENADKNGLEAFGIEQWNLIKGSIDGSETDEQTISSLSSVFGSDVTDEQKKAAFEYVNALKAQQAVNTIKEKDKIDNPNDVAVATESAYDEGSELKEPSAKHKAKSELDKAEKAIANDAELSALVVAGVENPVEAVNAMRNQGFTEERIQKAKDYYTAYHRMSGLTDELIDRVNSQIESANKEVDANTNVDENTGTRTIIPVTLRDGRQGYVIKGTITPGEKGGIDINKSDSYIVVRVDGKNLPMNPNKDLVSVGQITTPEILKEYNGTQLREQLINQEIGEIDWNPATPNPKVGDSFEMDGVTVTIVSHDGQGGMFVVPTDQWQAAQGNEKQTQKLVMQAQQAGVVPASMFKQWASDQLDAQEEAVAVQQEVASGEAVGEQVNAGVNNSETPNGSNLSPVEDKHPMTEDEAASFIFQMEANAEPIPEIEFTPENWKAAFGENGTIETPIGTVKMGENQISKLFLKKRTKEFGMIAPTLSNPDIIIEEFSRAKEGESERESSYLFIKTFIKDGQKVRYYTSVTVLQEGMEVSISSHVLGEKQVPKKLMEGNVIYIKEALLSNSSDGHLAEQPNAVPDLLPTQESNAPLSTNKDSEKNVQSQEKEQKPFHEREKEDVFRELGEMYGDKMPHKVEVTAKALAEDVVKAQKKLDDAQEKLDNAPIGRDSKQKEARDKAQQELDAIKIEANFWNEMDADIKKAQAEREAMLNPKVEVNMSEEPMDASEFVAQQLANGNITLTSESFKKETGYGETERKKFMKIIRKAENGGMTIEEAGERLMEMDRENGTNFFDQSDPNAGRDAIINMLGMARTWGDIANYIRDNRQRQAEADVEGIRSEMEEAIWSAYHVTPEEYATMLEMEMQENPYEGVDLAALDAIFAEKEFGEEQKSEEYESGTDVEGNQGQSELLSEEQPGDTTGDQPGETVKQDEGIGGGTPVESETPQAGSSVGRGVNVFAEAERIDKEERRRKPLRERAREWSNALGVKVNFLESIDDVDAQTRAQIEAEHANGSGVPGWVAPSGEVYFFMPDLQDIKDIDETYIHEVVAHIGMEKLLGKERFAELCDKVWEMMPQSEKDYYENEYPGVKEIKDKTKRHRRAADEYIAHLAEKENLTPEERTIWDQIVQFFRESLDKALNGIIGKSQITNEDISNLIKASYANLKKEAGKDITSQIENARNEVDLDPTDAQKEAGNYKKGHVKIDGYDITIENPKGGTRSGTDKNGKEWSITMNNDYGYIRGTEAVDGDHIDVFLSDNPTEGNVFVVDQTNEDGTFDESKVMYGFNSLEEARAAYLSNYDVGWENRIMAITEVLKDEFKKWIDSSHRKTKAFSEYKNVKVAPSIEETNVSRMADIEARILEIEGRRNEISDELAETPAYDVMKVAELRAEEWDLGQEQSELEAEYTGLRAMNDESNAILEEEGSELRFKTYKSKDGKETKYKQLSLFGEENEAANDGDRPDNVQREGNSTISRLNHLRELQEGEICNVERKFSESKEFSFTRGEKVESTADIAYIFKSLEDEAVENSFVAIANGDNITVVHLGMGAQTQTVVDTSAIIAAVERLNADKVFFVHNHPSGEVRCSRQDILTYQSLKKVLGSRLEDGIIINTRSGKYGLFNSDGLVDANGKIASEKTEYPINVYKFNKQAFNVDVIPTVEPSSSGIAEFISTQRLGKRDKVNALLLNNQFGCVGNILIDNSKNLSYITERITNDAIAMGARKVVIYGRYPFVEVTNSKTNFASYLSRMISEYSQGNVNLIDIIQIDEPYSRSANDEGVRFRTTNRNQEIFVSNAQKAVEGIKQEKATPQQWLAMIEKNSGLKAGEDKWLGLSDWLKESDKKSLTKAEILDFINQNKIVIEEVKYSQNATDIDDLFDEYEALYENEGAEAAHTEMISRYGEEFDSAFKDVGGELRIVNQKIVDNLLSKSINSTRLKFTTIGLDNKAEIALTVPTIEPWNVDDEIHFGDAGEGRSVAWIRFGETAGYDVKLEKAVQEADNAVVEFQNSMADKYLPDGGSGDASEYIDYMSEDEVKELRKLIDAHLEAKYTLDNNMKRVLVIDEIQSKRHQEGREKGYKSNNAMAEEERLSDAVVKAQDAYDSYTRMMGDKYNGAYEDIYGTMTEAEQIEADRLEQEVYAASERYNNHQVSDIPEAPFEKNWSELAFKRMLRYAAENGFDKVAWTKGAQQADRYNLRNVVDSIAISKSSKEEGKYHLTSYDKEDMPIDVASGNKTPEELTELFGKAVANELIEGVNNLEDGRDTFILEGAALEVGGEGMKGFYDKILPSFVNKYVKKWGTKVQDIELPNVEEAGRFMHSVDVTEAMKESIMEGQTMFRISDKGRQIQNEVDKFTSKYNSKEVALIDSEMTDGELEDTMPFTTAKRIRKEIKEGTLGGYLPNTDKIYIFVDNQELDDLEDTLFHENMHAIFGETNIPNEFNEASKDKFKTLREVIRSNYPEKKWAEEVFVNVAANAMVNNDFKFIDKYLPEVYREEFYIKLKEFGYETEQEIRRRIVVGNTSSESGAQSEKRQAMEESDGGSRKSESTEQTERLRQLFDQVADMGLEGVLGNKEYASLMTDIYKALPEDVRLGVAESASKNYNGNVAPAVSDYLNHAEASIWDKVVAIIRDALRKIGFDVDLNANDVKYILWRSKKPLDRRNVLDVAEDIDAIRRFRITGSITRFKSKKKDNFDVSDKRDKLLKEYDAFLKTGKFNFIEAFQDRMYSLKVLMDKIVEATGKKVRDYEDAYKAENQLGSINKPMQEKYLKNFYKPLLEAMKTLSDKYGREVVERYIYCKSGLERNVVLRQRDADEAYNSSKAELDEKLAKNEIDQAQYNILLQQAEDQRQKTLSEDVDYSGIRGMLFNVKAQAIQKEYEEGKIDKNTRDARLNQLEANMSTVVKDWKKFAEDQVAALEGPGKASKAELDALWDKINAATNETLRMDYESGMIDQDTYNAEKNMMKYYVPLRNWDDTTAEEMYEYRSDLVRPVSSNQKRAKGRESQADNPIATIGLMAQSAIVRGNRNKVKQKFYAFVANRETSLATVRDVWYVKDPSTGDWTPQYADTTSAKDSAEFDAIIEQFEANMKALEEQGQAFRGKLPFGMKFKASASQKKAHVVPVMINGVEYAVYVNGNPRAAQAINGETNNESVKSTSEWIDKLKRLYGAGLTSWNPDFIIPNLVRDTIHASTMTMLDAGPMAAIKYMFNTPKMFWNVGKMVTGLGKANPKLEAYFKEFVDNGGETGYTAINTLEDYKKEYDKLIDEAKGIKASAGKNVKKAFEAIAKVLEAANRIAEDVNRFNAYVSARESGETIMRSVDAAKNITVNFNRKGAMSANNTAFGTVANAMSKWILFFNPAVQGIAQIVTKSKMNPKRAASMGATILASGFMMPMLNEMLVAASGDDEEDNYWNQSDYKRRNNWMLFTGDGYITFPLPPILRELYGIGDVMYGALTGHISAERAAMDVARQVQSAVGFFNLIPEVSQEPDMVTYAKGFAPDIAAPILDVISNTNFMGRPIAKWTDFNEYDPEYERVYKGTSKHWVELSMLLNEVGGNEGRRSDLWGNFINPAMMEHLITSYGGGIGKTINNLVGMALAEGEDNVDPFRKTPIIPRFYTPNDEKTVVPGINRKYYDYNYKYNVAKKALKNYQEGIESGEHPEWQKHIDEMKKNNEIEFINYFKAMDKKLKKLQNLLKGNPTNKEKLEEQIVDLKAMVSAKSWEILN